MDKEPTPERIQERHAELLELLRGYGRLAVAYSGGVDSALLLHAARRALGRENALGLIVSMEALAPGEVDEALALAHGMDLPVRALEISALELDAFRENDPERCYFCKKELMGTLIAEARSEGFDVLADGSTLDDQTDDYRPGMRAAHELGIVSPLLELKMRKAEIRALARAIGLPNWSKPSAACLASRIPYGVEISRERLESVGRAEQALRALGFAGARARWHGEVVRIEAPPADIERLMAEPIRSQVVERLKAAGFRYVAADLEGYRTGSMNETLNLNATNKK